MTVMKCAYPSPLGTMTIFGSETAVQTVTFDGQKHERAHPGAVARISPAIAQMRDELEAYFAGQLQVFTVIMEPQGTPFQQRVWAALLKIGFGETSSYGAIAAQLGQPKASRAVGAAVGRNPIGIAIPCHRIVGAAGALTGYAAGLDRKRALLALEGGALFAAA